METIIDRLETLAEDIKGDILSDWNESKHLDSVQLMKVESAIALLKSVGENRNI